MANGVRVGGGEGKGVFPHPFCSVLFCCVNIVEFCRRVSTRVGRILEDMGYTKLFSSIVASTIWREDDKTRIVWITMLAMKNERHIVEASIPGLADMARVSLKECEAALGKLEGPDKYSRNQENKGRRIEPCPGGWLILNGEHYRQLLSADERREYQRTWAKNKRDRKGKTASQVRAENESREARFVEAEGRGDQEDADRIAAEGLG